MNIADLHIHSFFSDGDLSPADIVEESISKNISYISITDHDNLTGYKKANSIIKKSKYNQIKLIPGIELSSSINDSSIHLLAYFFDPENNDWNEKSIIGAVAFVIMCLVMVLDLLTGWLGRDLAINEFVYDSFVLVVLGCFGIAGLEKFAKK